MNSMSILKTGCQENTSKLFSTMYTYVMRRYCFTCGSSEIIGAIGTASDFEEFCMDCLLGQFRDRSWCRTIDIESYKKLNRGDVPGKDD